MAFRQLGSLRPAQMGSPMPRSGTPRPSFADTKSCQAEMMRAGFRPRDSISANCTTAARSPSSAWRRRVRAAPTATSTGSPAETPALMNGIACSTKSSSPS